MGSPAKVRRPLTDDEVASILEYAANYVRYRARLHDAARLTMIPAIRGTHDILPGEVEKWQHVERVARALCERYGYVELRTPVIEREELFAKGTGETTDIVQKEMYSFTDKGGERITLRPEATPSMVRAYVEHSLEQALAVRQALLRWGRCSATSGRRRAATGSFISSTSRCSASAIRRSTRKSSTWPGRSDRRAAASPQAELVINSVGCAECRPRFQEALLAALGDDLPKLCQRLPAARADESAAHLRLQGAGRSADHRPRCRTRSTTSASRARRISTAVQRHLTAWDIPWRLSHRLVRGLDYYTRTTFEILGQTLGAQNALLGGGRYDGLVKQLGGPDRAGHRLRGRPRAAGAGAARRRAVATRAARVRRRDRRRRPRARRCGCCASCAGRAWRRRWSSRRAACKAQMKRADRLGARVTLIVGGDELARGEVTLRDMRDGRAARACRAPRDSVTTRLRRATVDA